MSDKDLGVIHVIYVVNCEVNHDLYTRSKKNSPNERRGEESNFFFITLTGVKPGVRV